MAQVTREILKSYFRTGKYPTEEQFATLIDSLRHYLDEVPMSKVTGLSETLNSKANIIMVSNKAGLIDIKDYMPGGAYEGEAMPLKGGMWLYKSHPISHWRIIVGEGDILDSATSTDLVFCVYHKDNPEQDFYVWFSYDMDKGGWVYQDSYYRGFLDDDDWILEAFGEALATHSSHGLMSAEDKTKLDSLPSGGGSDSAATAVMNAISSLSSAGGMVRIGDTIIDFNSYNEVHWKKIDLLTFSTNGMGGPAAFIDSETNGFIGYDSNYEMHYIYTNDQNGNALTVESDGETFNIPGWTDVVVESGKTVYAIVLSVATVSGTQNLSLKDEDENFSLNIAATTTMTEHVLDFGTTGLPVGKNLILAPTTSGEQMNLQIKVTLKVIIA